MLLEQGFEVVYIAMPIDMDVGPGEPASVDQARVVEGVAEDDILWASESLYRSEVGRIPGGEERGRRLSDELPVSLFGASVRVHGARDQSRGGGAYALVVGRRVGGSDEVGMIGKTQVVVGAEAEDGAPVDLDLGALGTGDAEGMAKQASGLELGEGLADLGLEGHGRI